MTVGGTPNKKHTKKMKRKTLTIKSVRRSQYCFKRVVYLVFLDLESLPVCAKGQRRTIRKSLKSARRNEGIKCTTDTDGKCVTEKFDVLLILGVVVTDFDF